MKMKKLELTGTPIISFCMILKKNDSRASKDLMELKSCGLKPLNKKQTKDLILSLFTSHLEPPQFFVLRKQQKELEPIKFRSIQTLLPAQVLMSQSKMLYKLKFKLQFLMPQLKFQLQSFKVLKFKAKLQVLNYFHIALKMRINQIYKNKYHKNKMK